MDVSEAGHAWCGGSDPVNVGKRVRHAAQQLAGAVADEPHAVDLPMAIHSLSSHRRFATLTAAWQGSCEQAHGKPLEVRSPQRLIRTTQCLQAIASTRGCGQLTSVTRVVSGGTGYWIVSPSGPTTRMESCGCTEQMWSQCCRADVSRGISVADAVALVPDDGGVEVPLSPRHQHAANTAAKRVLTRVKRRNGPGLLSEQVTV